MDKVQQHIQTVREGLELATPGPWNNLSNHFSSEVGFGDDKEWICQLWYKDERDMPNHRANAHLIANSPTWLQQSIDMLEDQQTALKASFKVGIDLAELNEQLKSSLEQQQREVERLRQVALLYGSFIAELADNTPESISDQCRNVLGQGSTALSPPIDYKARYEELAESVELLYETLGMRAASCVKMLEGELPTDQQNRVSGKYEAYSNVKGEVKMLIPHGEVTTDGKA